MAVVEISGLAIAKDLPARRVVHRSSEMEPSNWDSVTSHII
jgi:hypothetical protein